MLRLDQTTLLLDALRPPQGMEIDAAVGTTFTLDLTALLTIPVAASFGTIAEGPEPADLLETIRRYSERTVLFCQAGAISVPSHYRTAHTLIEDTVVEVKKPDGGIFHPKVWIVRFSGAETAPLHRVLVMSRNLTFDKAWDVIVRLDEDTEEGVAMDSVGIVEFLNSLPTSAARDLSDRQRDLVTSLSTSLARARLVVPQPFTSGRFVPLIKGSRQTPFCKQYDASLAVSPFLTGDAVTSFFKPNAKRKVIVSRPAALNAQASLLRGLREVYRIKDSLLDAQEDLEAFDSMSEGSDSETTAGLAIGGPSMRGLHAKFYVQDHGKSATAWLGSANLTGGAFGANVDILVELSGPKEYVGVDRVINKRGRKDDLSWIVEPHPLPENDDPESDPEEGISPIELNAYDIASKLFTITYSLGDERDGGPWAAELVVGKVEELSDAVVFARPLSLLAARSVEISSGRAQWNGLLEEEITPFVVVTLKADGSTRNVLVRADIAGDPPSRRRSVIAQAIKSPEDFLRYLAALLGFTGASGRRDGSGEAGAFGGWIADIHVDRVLEDLLTTASRNPTKLESLDQTLATLKQDERFGEVVPSEFSELWDAVYEARKDAIG
ncbi:phospholipase D family protein [Crenobacter intestini]|uniref:PLD phosphodiesterase domain-containing protein n=1 Tax=Crenobacter intestini TaxID=2563443 RepID=A0A4T0UNK8_9NEIS|nr:phospholipase D family protein [Crenobacter intestini]TIC80332.1 hypothetical protein E5K04_12570 [Crenobacter intestini]